MVNTAHTTPCLSSSRREQGKGKAFSRLYAKYILEDNFSPSHGLIIAKGGCYTFWKVSVIVFKMLCQAVVHSPLPAIMSIFQTSYFLYFSSTVSSQALVDCIERFGNNAYQDTCAFLIKCHLCVGARLPRHTFMFFSMMIPFLEALKHQNSSNQKKL